MNETGKVNWSEVTGAGRSDDVWIESYSGGKFHILYPKPEEVQIDDIAHALAMQCRFTGHVKKFYSVAEHCIHVSRLVPPSQALQGLLHDASEAYLSDIARPTKHFTGIGPAYFELEDRIMGVISSVFKIPTGMTPEIKWADNAMLGLEGRQLMHNLDGWASKLPGLDFQLGCYSPEFAEHLFLERFFELTPPDTKSKYTAVLHPTGGIE